MWPLAFTRFSRPSSSVRGLRFRPLLWAVGGLALSPLVVHHKLHLDAVTETEELHAELDSVTDPDTGISFPKTIRVGAKMNVPLLQLLGVGVRTVSFLGIKVYSVALYADLTNPKLKIPPDLTPEDKLKHIIQSSSCLIRIVPTRTTSYTHLRDAFVRALYARLALGKKEGTLTEEDAFEAGAPIRKLKTLFPNSPLAKHTPLDIFLPAPIPGQPRALIFRDLGSIENDWLAHEFVLHYFEGGGPSPQLKKSVVQRLGGFTKDMVQYNTLTPEQVQHFMDHGFIVIKEAFTREKAAEWTSTMWTRLGLDPNDRATWDRERIHMPYHKREKVATFAPKAWEAIKDLLGGEERIDKECSAWGDSFIVNFGTKELEDATDTIPPKDLTNWHVDGDFFVHFLDSPEQALLVIPIFAEIKPKGGGTYICTDGIDLIAQYLAAHPEGVLPTGHSFTPSTSKLGPDDPGYWSHLKEVKRCTNFVEMTGNIGDVVLLHPLMLHSASKNYLRIPRIITNPPVSLKEPFRFFRENPDDYSLVEKKTLKALGIDKLDFKITTERKRVVPKRVEIQQKMLEEERLRLGLVV